VATLAQEEHTSVENLEKWGN